MKQDVTFLSFGAGVQSTAILLLIKYEQERLLTVMARLPDFAVFADTGADMGSTYSHLEVIKDISPIPLHVVNNGSLLMDVSRNWSIRSFIPLFTKDINGKKSILKRKCTSEFKVIPIQKFAREKAGLKKGERGNKNQITTWLGISTDEASRIKPAQSPTFRNVYPLIELGLSRQDCYAINKKYGVDAPKSRCFCCPYISDWHEMKKAHPVDFQKAVEFDASIREITNRGQDKIVGATYLHRSCLPLDEAVHDQGHLWHGFADDFDNECEGVCGL
jgi:hypothetical protein